MPTEGDLVGEVVKVTLTTGDVVRGTVMSISKEQQVLALLLDPNSKPVGVRLIRLPFIASAVLAPDASKQDHLPPHIGPGEPLPTLVESEPYNRKFTKQWKKCDAKRGEHFGAAVEGEISIPIGACDVFDKVARVYPETRWGDDFHSIAVNEDVVIVGDPDWRTPSIRSIGGGSGGNSELVKRIMRLVGV